MILPCSIKSVRVPSLFKGQAATIARHARSKKKNFRRFSLLLVKPVVFIGDNMSDWDTVTILRKKPPKASALKTEQAVNAARRQGLPVETQQKFGAGTNKQHVTTKNTAKLDRETEELRHEKVSLDLGKLIMQGRQSKGMSQKDLATKICEKPQIVNDYEAGRGIPNNIVLGKIERAIGIKLRGKERGQPLQPPGGKK